ncbi:hypothetical protein F7725_011767, partial [Dissostichus mawsoni]
MVGKRLVQRLWYRFLSWLISNTFSHSFSVIWLLMLSAVCSSSRSSFPPNYNKTKTEFNTRHVRGFGEEGQSVRKLSDSQSLQSLQTIDFKALWPSRDPGAGLCAHTCGRDAHTNSHEAQSLSKNRTGSGELRDVRHDDEGPGEVAAVSGLSHLHSLRPQDNLQGAGDRTTRQLRLRLLDTHLHTETFLQGYVELFVERNIPVIPSKVAHCPTEEG